MKKFLALLFCASILCCSSDDRLPENQDDNPHTTENMYFPPLTGSQWQTKSLTDLGWNQNQLGPLLEYLEQKNTRSFMILVNGRIVIENYFNGHNAASPWYWASAGKTLTAAVVGIAEQENLLSLQDPVSEHLGTWTSLQPSQEEQIRIENLLQMTSGLQDVGHGDCTTADCLTYLAAPGTRWAYHNVYVKLQDVVSQASGQHWNAFFNAKLKARIGMNGSWVANGGLNVYWSNTRSMARFGLLALNQGKWDGNQIVNQDFFNRATSPSQNINKSYGYLWWINGQTSFHLPQSQMEFSGSLIPNAPSDMYMALGKNDQKIYVVPSKKLVVIRMGEAADGANFALSEFDNALWAKISALIQ